MEVAQTVERVDQLDVMRAESALHEVQPLPVQLLRFRQVVLDVAHLVGEVHHGLSRAEVRRPEDARHVVERATVGIEGFGEPALTPQARGQTMHQPRLQLGPGAGPLQDRQRLAIMDLELLIGRRDVPTLVDGLGDFGRVRRERATADVEHLLRESTGLLDVAVAPVHPGELKQALGERRLIADFPPDGHRALEQTHGFVERADVVLHLPDDVEQARLRDGLIRQRVGARRAAAQQIADRHVAGRPVTGRARPIETSPSGSR